jgi:hypothetical protein
LEDKNKGWNIYVPKLEFMRQGLSIGPVDESRQNSRLIAEAVQIITYILFLVYKKLLTKIKIFF